MLTEIVQPQPGNGQGSDTDLSALAEHLSRIADALRKTGSLSPGGQAALQAEYTASLNQAQTYSGSTSEGATTHLALNSDVKIQRRRNAELARDAYAIRRRRAVIFDNDELFGEPAWDILLDLYVANAEQKSVSVSSACIGSAAPPTTGLRWLGVLSEQGLILREHDPEDQRRVLVRLTEKGLSAMDEYFESAGLTA